MTTLRKWGDRKTALAYRTSYRETTRESLEKRQSEMLAPWNRSADDAGCRYSISVNTPLVKVIFRSLYKKILRFPTSTIFCGSP